MMNKCMYSVKSKLKLSTLSLFEGWIVGVVAIKCIIDQVWGQDSGITDVIFFAFFNEESKEPDTLAVSGTPCSLHARLKNAKKITPVMRGSFFERTRLVNEGLIIDGRNKLNLFCRRK